MTCPEPGRWRMWLDGELAEPVAEPDEHIDRCGQCRATVADVRANAALAASAIATLDAEAPAVTTQPTPVVEPVHLKTLREKQSMNPLRWGARWRVALGGLAAALLLTILIGTPQGRTAAADFLAQFRSERFTVVTIDPSQGAAAFEHLEQIGTISGTEPGEGATAVGSAAEASALAGFPVLQPDPATLPAGVDPSPRISVMPASTMRLTFDQAKAQEYFLSIGRPDLRLPENLHGASLVVNVPTAVMMEYGPATDQSLAQGLIIGQSGELTVGVEGNATLADVRDFALSLPGDEQLTQQLRAIEDWQNTLPIPVPVDEVAWEQTRIGGGEGLILADNSGVGSGAIWQRDGRIYGVAGPLKADEVRRVADSLR